MFTSRWCGDHSEGQSACERAWMAGSWNAMLGVNAIAVVDNAMCQMESTRMHMCFVEPMHIAMCFVHKTAHGSGHLVCGAHGHSNVASGSHGSAYALCGTHAHWNVTSAVQEASACAQCGPQVAVSIAGRVVMGADVTCARFGREPAR